MSSEWGRKIILTVDDVSLSLMTVKSILSRYFDIRVAKTGGAALYILGNVKVDLILLDIEMPGMSGFEFINIMREIPDVKDIPIIFVSSHSKANILEQAVRVGVKDYIVKPINARLLTEKVFKALDMKIPE